MNLNKNSLINQTEEVQIIGQTRAIYGPGLSIKNIYFKNDFTKISFKNLFQSEEKLIKILYKFGIEYEDLIMTEN